MKILFITAWYPTKENPVNGVFVREHAKAVSLSGDEVTVIYGERSKDRIRGIYEMSDNMEEGIRTLRISYFPSPFRPANYFVYLWSTFKVSKSLMKTGFKPDVIHAHVFSAGVPAILLGKFYGIPVVITEHWSGFPQKKLNAIEEKMAKFSMNRADWILPVSYSLQKGIESYGIKGKFRIVPNVVDPSLFYPVQKNPGEGNKKKILFVGSLNEIKGLPLLFHALAKLRKTEDQWQLDVVGDGPARQEYEELVGKLNLMDRVRFHGCKPKSEVAEFMRKADLLVLPSLFETFSVVAAEALAAGVPLLATHSGGPEEFITEEVGLLVPPNNVEALLNGLDYMLNHLEQFTPERVSRYALERFSLDQIGGQLHGIYLECVEK